MMLHDLVHHAIVDLVPLGQGAELGLHGECLIPHAREASCGEPYFARRRAYSGRRRGAEGARGRADVTTRSSSFIVWRAVLRSAFSWGVRFATTHFPFGPRGSVVSGRQTKLTTPRPGCVTLAPRAVFSFPSRHGNPLMRCPRSDGVNCHAQPRDYAPSADWLPGDAADPLGPNVLASASIITMNLRHASTISALSL